MNLYLSSMDIPAHEPLMDLVGKSREAALLVNARDHDPGRDTIIEERVRLLGRLGMETNVVDLRKFNKEKNVGVLKRELGRCGLIWVLRGNTYVLRDEMEKSGFDTIAKDLLENEITYGGDSAGALVAGTSLAGINLEASDPPELASRVIEEGLGLVQRIVVPHHGHPAFAELTAGADAWPKQEELLRLKDGEAAVFIDGSYEIIEA